MKNIPSASLIITTYNWKEALEITLLTVLNQTIKPNEIIIADDGSGEETKELINYYKEKSEIPIVHSWQKDKGFRLTKSRNKAIALAKFDYIIMIDGDLILHKNFIKNHVEFAQNDSFVIGTRVLLNKKISDKITATKNYKQSFFFRKIKNRKNCINSNILSLLFSQKTNSHKKVRGCNMAFYRSDIIKVNGFNEAFIGWGREDTEIVVRMLNAGLIRRNLKFNANTFHLYHKENSRKQLPANDKILNDSITEKLIRCKKGINQYIDC